MSAYKVKEEPSGNDSCCARVSVEQENRGRTGIEPNKTNNLPRYPTKTQYFRTRDNANIALVSTANNHNANVWIEDLRIGKMVPSQ